MDSLEKKIVLSLVMTLFVVAFIPFYWAREPARQAAAIARIERRSIEKGATLFSGACAACHGAQAQGGVGPALKGKDATFVQSTVRSGKGIMPAFSPNQISISELEDIIIFLNSLK
ncbi:MAG: cytochrome c [Chloroflexi bacterium]|nr:cytochrome c [Chloroflexota bacterium]